MATEAAAPSPGHSVKVDAGTEYEVLSLDEALTTPNGTKDRWLQVGTFTARSAEAAIKAHAEKTKPASGTFVAIPARSWNPVKVATKTVTTLEIEAA